MKQYCIYLRKSRKDFEAEERGEGETLARHKTALLSLAKKSKLNITQIYEEIVSGETISARPVMQKLLAEVEQGLWSGVLVMEVERLARGDTIDQGIVAQAFKMGGTKIVTPLKTYDPNNEFDEEYFEFGLFMSRREYKAINRRLQRGREAAAKEGKYVASIAPYGYEKVKIKNDKGYTLQILPEQSKIIKLIFSLYVDGIIDEFGEQRRLGIQQIAKKLNEMGIPPIRHDYWQKETIRDIIINPIYMGKIRWGWRKTIKKKDADGSIAKGRPRNFNEDCIMADGLHAAIIESTIFEKAQELLAENPPAPVGYKNSIQNPLSGIIVCGKCGRKMVLRKATTPNKPDYLVCHARSCDNVSTPLHYVETRLLDTLNLWLQEYELELKKNVDCNSSAKESAEKALEKTKQNILTLQKQLENTYDLLEQGIYTTEVFLERSQALSTRINEAQELCEAHERQLNIIIKQDENKNVFIPKIKHLLSVYNDLPSAAQKNKMLKEVLQKAVYLKLKSGAFKGVSPDDFELTLYPKLPKENI